MSVVPIPDGGGFAVSMVEPTLLDDHLASVKLIPGQVMGLLDTQGRMVRFFNSHGDGTPPMTWEQRDRTRLSGVLNAMRGETYTSTSFRGDLTDEERLAVWMPTHQYGWIIGASWPVNDALLTSRESERRELIIFAGIGLVIVASALLAARWISSPLERLAHHAALLGGDFAGGGNYHARRRSAALRRRA